MKTHAARSGSQRKQLRLTLLAIAAVLSVNAPIARGATTPLDFDANVLKAMGIDQSHVDDVLAQHEKPRGNKNVGIYLNGKYSGAMDVNFGENGDVCLDKAMLDHFMVKPDLVTMNPATGCVDLAAISQFETKYERNENALRLNIADYYLDKASQYKNIQSGGFGTFVNYSVSANRGVSGGSASDSVTALMSWGANLGNYLLRSDFSYSKFSPSWGQGYSHQRLNSAYVETDALDRYRVRAGYISVGNSLFGAGQVMGATLSNDAGLRSGDSTVNISGTATGYAQVEVYQQGRLIFSRPVPAGAFRFEAVPLHTAYADAEVVVRESSGGEQRFVVPKAAFSVSQSMAARFSMFAGNLDASRGLGNGPVFGAEYRLPFYGYVQPFVGAMAARHYVGVGSGIGLNWIPYDVRGDANVSVSRSGRHGDLGVKLSTNFSTQLFDTNPYISLGWQSRHYRDLGLSQQDVLDPLQLNPFVPRYNVSAGMSMPLSRRFGAGFSYSRNTYYDAGANNALSVFGTYTSANYSVSGNVSYGWMPDTRGSNSAWSAYLTLRIPFQLGGKAGASSSYVNHAGRTTRTGTSIDQTITDNLRIGAGADRTDGRSRSTRHYAQAFWRTPYTNTSWYYTGTNGDSQSYSANLSGAFVVAGRQFAFSPERVQDTFGIADTGIRGYVGMDTPTSRVITNYDGLAVIPQLFEGRSNVLSLVTKSMPDGAYVKNPRQEVEVKRGAVAKVSFASNQDRQYLVKLESDAARFPLGSRVLDEKAQLLGYTIDENILMLGEESLKRLSHSKASVMSDAGQNCRIDTQSLDPSKTLDLIEVKVFCGENNA